MARARSGSVRVLLWAGAALLVWPATAMANPVIPLIVVVWPLACLTLLPVVLVEAAVARVVLGWGYGRALKMAAVANLFSTLVGVPLATCLNPFALMSPVEHVWALAAVVLPLYAASVASEALVADKFLELDVSRRPMWRWALIANALSYALIAAVLFGWAWVGTSGAGTRG